MNDASRVGLGQAPCERYVRVEDDEPARHLLVHEYPLNIEQPLRLTALPSHSDRDCPSCPTAVATADCPSAQETYGQATELNDD